MKKILHLITLVIISSTFVFSAENYPEWFLFQERYPDITIGFSYNKSKPVVDAERMYCAYKECFAYGTLYRYQNLDQKLSDYYYIFSPDMHKEIRGKLFPIATFGVNMISQDYISAFSLNPEKKISSKTLNIKTVPKPDWLVKQPYFRRGAYHYGVGVYAFIGNENDAWKTAEEKAVFNIMNGMAVQIHSVIISSVDERGGDHLEKANATKLKYRLRNIHVVERWRDPKSKMVYVLVKIHNRDIFSPNLKAG